GTGSGLAARSLRAARGAVLERRGVDGARVRCRRAGQRRASRRRSVGSTASSPRRGPAAAPQRPRRRRLLEGQAEGCRPDGRRAGQGAGRQGQDRAGQAAGGQGRAPGQRPGDALVRRAQERRRRSRRRVQPALPHHEGQDLRRRRPAQHLIGAGAALGRARRRRDAEPPAAGQGHRRRHRPPGAPGVPRQADGDARQHRGAARGAGPRQQPGQRSSGQEADAHPDAVRAAFRRLRHPGHGATGPAGRRPCRRRRRPAAKAGRAAGHGRPHRGGVHAAEAAPPRRV
ncbi:MAG: hypothetical protein AVDCRST_MAG50-3403, partial [uncultured Acidimicrobiales bacterium]